MQNKTKFFTGFFVGFIIAVFLSVGANVMVTQHLINRQEKKTEEAVQSNDTKTKLEYIGSIISQLYLEDYDNEDLIQGAYKGLVSALGDPYSVYYTEQEYKDLMENSSGVYCGIGVQVSQNMQSGIITVSKVFKDCPGEEAGMLPGDVIYEVAGTSVTGMDLTNAVALIKGDEGTYVEIVVFRESINDYVTLNVERRKVEQPTVEYEMLSDNIGYILLSGFEEVTAKQLKNAVDSLMSGGAKGLVVDVRDNPGGLLSSVNEILRYILPKGTMVYTIDKNGKKVTYDCDGSHELDIPMVVITNGNSASAAEIFSGALKDYNKATLVGTTTFGKGIVQSVIPLSDGSAVKLTVSKYYTPNGVNIHGTGITPDVEVELDEELKYSVSIPHDKDNQLQKALEVLKSKMN